MRTSALGLALLAGTLFSVACDGSRPLEPGGPAPGAPALEANSASEAAAVLGWNELARRLATQNRTVPQAQFRMFAYLSLAQYNAIVAAEDAMTPGTHASPRGAVAGASAEVLHHVFPGSAALIEEQLLAQRQAQPGTGEQSRSFELGEAVGRELGAAIVDRARGDGFVATWTATVPVCPGCWFSSSPPALPLLGQMRPFFLTSGAQFRPPPPPAFDSPEFVAALAEVRDFSNTRTEEQRRIAHFWIVNSGAHWNQIAAELIQRYHLNERRAAHALALAHMAAMDALIASHEAKYTYWLIRPSQADPAIVPMGLPNFPSYPSNHAAVSPTLAGVLGSLFPAEKERLWAHGQEAAISRLYGGIHYRFDLDAGTQLALRVVALALERDVRGHQPFPE